MADNLAGLLADGERAAFHGRPGAGVEPLRRAVQLATEGGLTAEAAAAGWLLGVCLASAGRYGSALEVLDPLRRRRPVGREPDAVGASASATLASVHRQLGRHAVAQGYDERALEGSGGTGEAGFDALLGLAADAVGLGDPGAAPPGWPRRPRWPVAAPSGGASGCGSAGCGPRSPCSRAGREDAVAAASEAVDLAEQSGAPRHVAKGLLFLGVAQVEAGRPGDAAGVLRRAGLLAESLGTLPLQWPVRAVLGALLAADATRGERAGLRVRPPGGRRDRRRPARGAARRVARPARCGGPAAGLRRNLSF